MNNMNNIPFPYEDIVNLEHPTSLVHPRMTMASRAAQFSSFAALSGHDEAINRTAVDHADRVENENDPDEEDF